MTDTIGKPIPVPRLGPIPVRLHTDERPYACGICGDRFKRVNHRNQHERTHAKTSPHKCDVRGQRFAENYGLLQHKRKQHGISTSRVHSCGECGEEFPRSGLLQQHQLAEYGPRRFQCDQCPMWCKRTQELEVHKKRAHSSDRPFKCERCASAYSLEADLRRHTMRCQQRTQQPEEHLEVAKDDDQANDEIDWTQEDGADVDDDAFFDEMDE